MAGIFRFNQPGSISENVGKSKKFAGKNKKGADPHTVPGARRSDHLNVQAGMVETIGSGISER
jgi:hypothetical protein